MGLYARTILPWATDRVCRGRPNRIQRRKVVPGATGRVLEIGAGSGLNFPFYDPDRVSSVVALDPSDRMLAMAEREARDVPVSVDFLLAGAEEIPLRNATIDTVVTTYTFCTIPDAHAALHEIARVLAPGGRWLFCEHGLAPDPWIQRWQRWLDPVWTRLAGGCHLGRDIPGLIRRGGFEIHSLESMYIPGWKPGSFNYRGRAETVQSEQAPTR